MNNETVEKNKIIYIQAEHIRPHPDNPRKELGDLSELEESIRKNGILQNLTVIPVEGEPGEYMALIGHRRHAAGVRAGIKEFPCKIAEGMDLKEQIAVMMEENMQRNDLTIYEQAQGFQMMLDLGDTEEQIAEKTGFSRTTVRRRLNIAKLDQKELEKKEQDESFQLSLKDLYELEKIRDIETRNRVLKDASNSRQLAWKVQQEVEKEKRRGNREQFESLFRDAGIPRAPKEAENGKYSREWDVLEVWDLDKNAPEELPEFGEGAGWTTFWGEEIAVVKPAEADGTDKEESAEDKRREERERAREGLREIQEGLRRNIGRCIRAVTMGEVEPEKESVEFYRELLEVYTKLSGRYYEDECAGAYAGKRLYEMKEGTEEYEKFQEWKEGMTPAQKIIAYMNTVEREQTYNYYAEYEEEDAERIKAVTGFLTKYGFTLSEEEEKLLNGTHERYRKEEEQ